MEIPLQTDGGTAAVAFDWLDLLEQVSPSLVIGCAAAVLDIAELGLAVRPVFA